EGLVMQFCAEDRKVQKDPADSCTYSSKRTGEGFIRNPITIEGFRHVLSGDGRGRVLVTMDFDVVNNGPGVATGEGLNEEVKFDISSPTGGMAFDCRKNDASEDTGQGGLPLTLHLENGKASLTCTSEISLTDLYKKEDYSVEFHLDYEYKVLAKVVGVKVKADSLNPSTLQ
ncbi:MAG TPA: hypothetical protein VJC07_03235, partial [Candidatus Nanoarchaeia archaeon]|nr:hypothetical protein [Candidatus Nanoarchaeia archaeon]